MSYTQRKRSSRRYRTLVSMVDSGNYQSLRAADWVKYLSIEKKLYGWASSEFCPFDKWDVDDWVFAMQWLSELIERCPRYVFESICGKDWVNIYTHHQERNNEDAIRACAEKMPYSTENLAFVIAAGFGEFINMESISGEKWSEIIECFRDRNCNLDKLSPDAIRACAEKMPYSTENLAFVIAAGFGEFINMESISGKKWSEIICLKPECFRYCNLEKLSPVDWLEIYQVRVACFNEVLFAVKDEGAKRDCII